MKLIPILAAIALAGCATHPVTIPPKRFQGLGMTQVVFVYDTASECHMGNAMACTLGSMMILPDPCERSHEFYAALVCHELGHRFRGWKHEKE
jgi:hypothetical protein